MNMVKKKVAELEGAQLNRAVAIAIGLRVEPVFRREANAKVICIVDESGSRGVPHYSTDWAHGGPLIAEHGISLGSPSERVHRSGGPNAGWGAKGCWSACTWDKGVNDRRSFGSHASSPLIAAMHCLVMHKLGDEVEVPS